MTREKAYEVASALEDVHVFELFMDEFLVFMRTPKVTLMSSIIMNCFLC